jgi:NitT/TauT family transport system substrate-binding protein
MREHGIVDSGDAASEGPGAMTDKRWADFFAVAAREGVYSKTLDYKSAYTLQFVQPKGASPK